MSDKENLHAGHRERLIKKFIESPDLFSEHEVLEVLLFYSIPRKDTNPLAHRLLQMFGSLEGVFSATKKQLMSVEGVGEKVATHLIAVFQVSKRIAQSKKQKVTVRSASDARELLVDYFEGLTTETFVILLLDKNYKLLANVAFTDNDTKKVSADIPELVSAINIYHPRYAIISHNHPSMSIMPSEVDDFTTKKINVILELHDVELVDHVIVAGKMSYSYSREDRLEEIKNSARLNNLFNKLEK